MEKNRQLLFSVTAKDCRWDYFRSSGSGGQNVNKVSSGARCTHIESGAVGQATDTRDQVQNKKLAFKRMAESVIFKNWHKKKTSEICFELENKKTIEEDVEEMMSIDNIKIEIKENDRWIETTHDKLLNPNLNL